MTVRLGSLSTKDRSIVRAEVESSTIRTEMGWLRFGIMGQVF